MNAWIPYFLECRKRLLRFVWITLALFTVFSVFSRPLYQILAWPLLSKLGDDQHLIATSITAPFFVPLKFAFLISLFFSIPYGLWQFWKFVAPGLYQHERRLGQFILFSSIGLFFSGTLFVYCVVFPSIFRFMKMTIPESVLLMPDMEMYLDFCTQMALAFGLAFQIPMITLVFMKLRIITLEQCQRFRPYFIVGAFIVAMLVTPPDVLSQILLAIPLCLLYEFGLLIGRYWISQD